MTKLSCLDRVPVTDTGTISQSLANAADLARHAEALGYERYWIDDHHGMTGIASAATAVVLAHVVQAPDNHLIGEAGLFLHYQAAQTLPQYLEGTKLRVRGGFGGQTVFEKKT